MNPPPYDCLLAERRGRDAAHDFVSARRKWPLTKRPDNPYPLTDPGDKRHVEWRTSFETTLKRWEGM